MKRQNDEILLEVRELCKYYPVGRGMFKKISGEVLAVDNVSFYLKRGETLGIVGESGCGKTTLGKCIVRLHKPTSGKLYYNFGEGRLTDILSLNKDESFNARKKIQLIFQDPHSSLNPKRTIFQAIDEPLNVHGVKDRAERMDIITALLESVNMSPQYMFRYPHEFSGGQRQRICIARAMSINPELIVCDEPVSALDISIQAQVLNLMKELQEQKELSYIFIAHDLSVVEYMSDRIMVMYLGKVVETAKSDKLYDNTAHPYTEALLSAVLVPEVGHKKDRIILEGDVPSPVNPPSGCRFHPRCVKCVDICRHEQPELKPLKSDPEHFVACHRANT